ncbi:MULTISPECIES: type II secretion system protein GspL [unclassified Polaromonas]|uniref:type II secretion system protein GspL n=1 Tax=unclassified Polaromonas TaxID=2638319 RepID=UPI000F07B123|nr:MULTISPECIES: type II secretion system protein GspL [unclassified Polaromonas]AYQ30280.1 general secretion pathway protein GspL [Polaromonas sp. SP1]QGJ18602.1 general secretion pathway protein GspL [Polaromonas sp. Pch-P]
MSTLIICLPPTPHGAASVYDYALTPDGRTLASHATVPAALLPAAERRGEVLAVLPASQMSWHSVELPKGIGTGSPRLRAVLENLLEDRLLDEPGQLHLALAPDAASSEPAWVAACDRTWLCEHLQALEAAGKTVTRIVPEFAPGAGALQLHVLGEVDHPFMVLIGRAVSGTIFLPLCNSALALVEQLQSGPDIAGEEVLALAEPALATLAEQSLQRKVNLLTRQQRWLRASSSPWDLAQFDLTNTSRTRAIRRFFSGCREVLQAPAWRPARWGAGALLVANLAGLNAWAWKEQSVLHARRKAIETSLTQTFPQVRVVVDAPLQMEREIAKLRRATGATSGRDLEAILTALGNATAAEQTASAIEFSADEARIKGLQLNAQSAGELSARLRNQGYSVRLEGDTVVVRQDGEQGIAP